MPPWVTCKNTNRELHREKGSRRHFVSITRRILAQLATPDDIEACVKAMASAHDRESQFLQTISEILVDVEDDDTFQSKDLDPRAIVIDRQMRIIAILSILAWLVHVYFDSSLATKFGSDQEDEDVDERRRKW
jgi:hypothetical protein